ncbi:MAG: uridine kinase [Fluviicola sp.]
MIIGICGGSGSGKTTLLKRLCSHFSDLQPSVFSMDNYYLPIEKQKLDENGIHNFDLPTALNREKLTDDLRKLVSGSSIVVKEYHFNAPPDKNVLITIEPSSLIIVEGLFLFHFEEVRELLDYSVFIKVDPEIQLDRRLYRDQESRGYSREAILYQWENHVKPCYQNYLLPFEEEADFRFRNDANADEDFQKLTYEIGTKMEAVKL